MSVGKQNFIRRFAGSLVLALALCAPLAAGAATAQSAIQNAEPEVADLNSTFAHAAARTTTITEPFKYDLKYPEGLTLLYNSTRGSRIQPCGCRALNLGGIDKEAAMVQTIRRDNPNTIYMDAGGFFREFTDPSMRLQTWYMLEALSKLDIQAINIGFPDLRQGMASLQFFEKKFHLPFVSANIVDARSGKPVFSPFKSFDVALSGGRSMKVALVGVTAKSRDTSRGGAQQNADAQDAVPVTPASRGKWMIAETNGKIPWLPYNVQKPGDGGAAPAPASGGTLPPPVRFAVQETDKTTSAGATPYRLHDPLKAAREMGQRLKPDHDYLVLMAYTSYEIAVKMAPELPEYDLIIAADYTGRVDPVRPSPNGPLVIGGEYDGKYLGIVEVNPNADKDKPPVSDADFLPILQTIKPLPEYTRFIKEFAASTEKLPVEKSSSAIAVDLYAGARSCSTCHIDAYNQWKTHKHSHAMKTLVDKNMHYNPDCLKCHTVAYRQAGGFTDIRVTPMLANVQCEVCHGPGEAHVKNMRAAQALKEQGKPAPKAKSEMRMTWNANFCMQCHNPANDPQFNFAEDVKRVRHTNTAPQRVRPTTATLEM